MQAAGPIPRVSQCAGGGDAAGGGAYSEVHWCRSRLSRVL